MVKQYGQLYLDTRHALLETEDAQTAGMMARQLLCHFSGKSPEAILADRDLYASEQVCRDMSRAVRRLLDGQDVNGGEGVKDPACLAMTTESLTREFPLYTPSLLNLVKTSETHVKGLSPQE